LVNYTTADGYPIPVVASIYETHDRSLFVATLGGIAKLDVHATIEHPRSRRLLMNGQKVEVMDVVQDRADRSGGATISISAASRTTDCCAAIRAVRTTLSRKPALFPRAKRAHQTSGFESQGESRRVAEIA
jgi:hypothetical protein